MGGEMKIVKYRLTLDMEIDPCGTPVDVLEHNLYQVVHDTLNSGTLTKGISATIEHYAYSVKRTDRKK
jgi:hypothetical protein